MKRYFAVLLCSSLTVGLLGGPAVAARRSLLSASGPGTASDQANLIPPDPNKELHHLSKTLKLKKNQRVDVGVILQERTREIYLLLDIDYLSQEYRSALAQRVIRDGDAQIASLLRNKQKRKFAKEIPPDLPLH